LGLATAAIDVHPPRATPRKKRLRRWFPWYGVFLRLGDNVTRVIGSFARLRDNLRGRAAGLAQARWTRGGSSYPVRNVLLRMLIPGWPQIFVGQWVRGILLLAAFLGLLALAVLNWGTDAGAGLFLLALAVHAASVLGVIGPETADPQVRLIYSVICAVVLGVVVYLPIFWIVTRLALPR